MRNPDFISYVLTHPNMNKIRDGYYRIQKKVFSSYNGLPVRTRLGFDLILNPHDHILSLTVFSYGVWEPEITSFVRRIVKPGYVVVDVGANLGYFTVLFSKLVGNRGKVYAFEPEPANFMLLCKNVEINKCENVVLSDFAISNYIGMADLYISDLNPVDHRMANIPFEKRKKLIVKTTTIDFIFGNKKLDLIKIDVQGHERHCIEGMIETINANPSLKIICEFWPYGLSLQGSDPHDFLDLIISLGMNIYKISSWRLSKVSKEELLKDYTFENKRYIELYLEKRSN